ncbi:serine/threonine-protein kinase [Scopulibacillus daqui]|uniref:Serine/threonine-protein kinase n=1 Tax=Scopulibacillus daqui TaxID=1469162 RepID=A0ABS2Q2K3_9BACL|nr:serine/threonine-protein kinase [Scopulibacillus daqui]MBM7646448.1 serine/threonine-protein kinase [Scopulibacillus daqui]
MMNHSMKNQDINLASGTMITGKWHGKSYQVIKCLGSGAQGTVYLAHSPAGRVAVKFSKDRSQATTEVNVLKELQKVQGEPLGPSLYDVDDWVARGRNISFYAMEYIRGLPLVEYLKVKGFDWACILMIQLLKDLERLHREGWIFGDLKPENLIVSEPGFRIRWLDVGGVTLIGRSVKEYTEFFDRGYWGFGHRKADPQYDLFAAAMILVYAAGRKRFEKQQDSKKQLLEYIKNHKRLSSLQTVLNKAITGKYTRAKDMRDELLQQINETSSPQTRYYNKPVKPSRKMQQKRRRRKRGWMAMLVLGVFAAGLYILYLKLYVM